ncbi:transglycosylase domain-containing protein [Schleiferilactobacillus harbinensis]|uniref:Transglycosylase domain-containing protein n=1 Tax=Schleiferilactobacillus harbinensis TaxID=304207 RepID=A0ABU7SXC4_9LACO|nr:transglycosylase domain-containing protein [Schleiferilactobacillus harbinensis]
MNRIRQWWDQLRSGMSRRFNTWQQTRQAAEETVVDGRDTPFAAWLRTHTSARWAMAWKTISFWFNVVMATLRLVLLRAIAVLVVAAGLALGIGLGYFGALVQTVKVPTQTALAKQINTTEQSSLLYYANNVKMMNFNTDLRRTPVKSSEISPWLKKAIVATEDENFYVHSGVVPKALIRAAAGDITGIGGQTGGSTLTQQLVKMQLLSSETTFKRKASEILLATRIDKFFSKDQILQAYLNAATFGRNNKGENIAGVEEAAMGLFGKHANNLSIAQAAYIAGMPQSPSIYTPYTQTGALRKNLSDGFDRKNTVLFRMYRAGVLTEQQYQTARKEDLKKELLPQGTSERTDEKLGYMYDLLSDQATYYLAEYLAKSDHQNWTKVRANKALYGEYRQRALTLLTTKNYQIHSTINKSVYGAMQNAIQSYGDYLGTTHTYTVLNQETGKEETVTEPVQNGMILLNNQTGAVLGFIGGRDYDQNQSNHAFYTYRSPGSSIKPYLVYGPAVDQKLIGTESQIADFEVNYNGYSPSDYGSTIQNRFISAKEALAKSYNIPAVNLYKELRTKTNPKTYMDKMGISLSSTELSRLGIALGGTDNGISVQQEASAFSTFANQGQYTDSYVIDKIVAPSGEVIYQHKSEKTQPFSAATAYIMRDMLRNVITEGTAASLSYQLNFDTDSLYGKTGTSNDNKDVWFVGSTPGITMASWIGYDNFWGHAYNLTDAGTNINQALWARVANEVYKVDPEAFQLNKTFSRPDTVKSISVLEKTGLPAGTITYKGKSTDVTGTRTTSLFNDFTPSSTRFEFGIGGTTKNYNLFWANFFGAKNGYGTVTKYTGKTIRDPNDKVGDVSDYDATDESGSETSSNAGSAWQGSTGQGTGANTGQAGTNAGQGENTGQSGQTGQTGQGNTGSGTTTNPDQGTGQGGTSQGGTNTGQGENTGQGGTNTGQNEGNTGQGGGTTGGNTGQTGGQGQGNAGQ